MSPLWREQDNTRGPGLGGKSHRTGLTISQIPIRPAVSGVGITTTNKCTIKLIPIAWAGPSRLVLFLRFSALGAISLQQ